MVKRAGIISTMDRAEIGRLVGCSPEGIPLQTVISNGMPHCSSSDSLERTLSSVVQSESDHTPSTQQTRVTVPRSAPTTIPRQLFPLFYTARSTKTRRSTSPPLLARKRTKSDTPLKPKSRFMPKCTSMQSKENKEQLYLDVGQKQFGHVTCSVCHMVYTYAEPVGALPIPQENHKHNTV